MTQKYLETIELRGTKANPYHKSVGAVIFNINNKVTLIKKPNNMYTLLRETQYLTESPESCLIRGAKEELGLEISVERYLGTLLAEFNGENGVLIHKSTDYFLARVMSEVAKESQSDEVKNMLFWFSLDKAKRLLTSQGEVDRGANEAEILARV